MIAAAGLVKHFRGGDGTLVKAVDGVSFTVAPGEMVGLLGANGVGKTTTMRLLATLLKPTAGTASIGGCDILADPLGVRRQLGYLSATTGVPDRLTPREVLASFGRLHGLAEDRIAARVAELVDVLGLAACGDRPCGRLSTGQRQRVSLGRALVHDPPALVLDEPTNGLDPAGVHEVRETIRGLGASGRTVVVSSHLLAEVQPVADTVTIIGRGRTLREGRVADILGSGPASVRLRVADPDAAARVLLASGMSVQGRPDGALTIGRPGGVAPEEVAWTLGVQGIWPAELGVDADNLEAVFLELTRSEHLGATQSDGGSARHGIGGAA